MPKDSNDDANIDEFLAELKNETSEESKSTKNDKHKNTESEEYEITENLEDDYEW